MLTPFIVETTRNGNKIRKIQIVKLENQSER